MRTIKRTVKRTVKADWELTIEERIQRAGWFHGGDSDWQSLPMAERERLAFAATGCAVAYCTWQAPVDCSHTKCLILRGELPAIAELNRTMRCEADSGWWRFIGRESGRGTRSSTGRKQLASLYRHFRKLSRQSGEYDLWKLGGVQVAMVGVMA